jgi:hydroxyacylglutathione hydrolase
VAIEIRSLRTTELGNAAHVVIERESGVAVVVDPVRDVDQYLEVAAGESVTLAWALETHVHNDFVSSARELVAASGTRIGASGTRIGASGAAGLRYPVGGLGRSRRRRPISRP